MGQASTTAPSRVESNVRLDPAKLMAALNARALSAAEFAAIQTVA